MKAKKEYYNARKLDQASTTQENTLRGVADTPADQVFAAYFTLLKTRKMYESSADILCGHLFLASQP